MIVKVRKIGNSAGILLSKSMMEQCSIKDEVNITVKNNIITIEPVVKPREGWEEQFLNAGSLNDTTMLAEQAVNDFDEDEWTW